MKDNETLAAMEAEFDGEEQSPRQIDEAMMARRLVWDLVPHAMAMETIAELGLVGASDEVEETEHAAAHYRSFATVPLQVLLWNMAHQMAVIQVATIKAQDPTFDELEAEDLAPLLFTACKAMLDEWFDVGIIHYSHVGGPQIYVEDVEGDDE